MSKQLKDITIDDVKWVHTIATNQYAAWVTHWNAYGVGADVYSADDHLTSESAVAEVMAKIKHLKDKDTVQNGATVSPGHFNKPIASDEELLASYVSDEEMAEVYSTMYGSHAIEKTQEELDKEYQDRLWKAIKEGAR